MGWSGKTGGPWGLELNSQIRRSGINPAGVLFCKEGFTLEVDSADQQGERLGDERDYENYGWQFDSHVIDLQIRSTGLWLALRVIECSERQGCLVRPCTAQIDELYRHVPPRQKPQRPQGSPDDTEFGLCVTGFLGHRPSSHRCMWVWVKTGF